MVFPHIVMTLHRHIFSDFLLSYPFFFVMRPARAVAPILRLNGSNDVFPPKDDPFRGQDDGWHHVGIYDTIRVYLTKLTGSQLSLPHGLSKKLKCETKNKTMSMIGPVQLLWDSPVGKRNLRWEGFVEKVGFEPGVKEWRSDGWREWGYASTTPAGAWIGSFEPKRRNIYTVTPKKYTP